MDKGSEDERRGSVDHLTMRDKDRLIKVLKMSDEGRSVKILKMTDEGPY